MTQHCKFIIRLYVRPDSTPRVPPDGQESHCMQRIVLVVLQHSLLLSDITAANIGHAFLQFMQVSVPKVGLV